MPATTAPLKEFPPSPRLLRASAAVRINGGRFQKSFDEEAELQQLLQESEEDRAELKQATVWLAEHFNRPAPEDVETEWLVQALSDARAKEREVETALTPLIDDANDLLAPRGSLPARVERLIRERRAILEGWVTHYRRLREMLARQLAERSRGEILRARPVAGRIDYAALSREHIARYPKIRARLAE